MTAEKPAHPSAEWLNLLKSNDPAQVSKALSKLEKTGSVNDLPAIIGVMAHISDPAILNHFTVFLGNIKSKAAPSVIAHQLADPANAGIRADLTRSCWESQLDYSPYLMIFAHLFIAGDYRLAVEAFTVIEYSCMEHPVDPALLKQIAVLVKNSIPDQPEFKQRLTGMLIQVLDPFLSVI